MGHPCPPFPEQSQDLPGDTEHMQPVPDHGEDSYRGSGRLTGLTALVTGADSGIGRAVALAYAREGADVAVSYLSESAEADRTRHLIEDAGQRALLLPGCQSAANRDPLSASKNDPLGAPG